MAYEAPSIRVRQRITPIASGTPPERQAYIAGGHAQLVQYPTDKATGELGYYDPFVSQTYAFPGRAAGSKLDPSYTRLVMENALLQYFHASAGSAFDVSSLGLSRNQIFGGNINFKDNGVTYPLDATFNDRDVRVGDVVRVRAVVAAEVYTRWTYVRDILPEMSASEFDAATADANNGSQAPAAGSGLQTAGPTNCVIVDSVDGSSYTGLAAGQLVEVYTVEVITGSLGGDATTARLRVTSASGTDDQLEITPSAFGVATPIGTRGGTATWDIDVGSCEDSADLEEVSAADFVPGQIFTFTMTETFTAVTAAATGTYTRTRDETYQVTVTRGGYFADVVKPQITITTARGSDFAGPITVTEDAQEILLANSGLTIALTSASGGLLLNDQFYVVARAPAPAAYNTLVLGHNLPEEVFDAGAVDVELSLYIRKDLEISASREGFSPEVNWEQTEDSIEVMEGLIAYDSSWVEDGVPVALPVFSEESRGYGKLYLEYRTWLNEFCSALYEVTEGSLDSLVSGQIHPDNPLKFGLHVALSNSLGVPVKFSSVCDPSDSDSWATAVALLDGRRDVRVLAPMTQDRTVWSLFESHVNASSGETRNRFRQLVLGQPQIREQLIADEFEGDDILVTSADYSEDSPNSLLLCPGFDFVGAGVVAGDLVRANYTTDGFGLLTYSTYTVAEVVNEETLRLVTGPTLPISVASKIEVWRNTTAEQETEALILANGFGNRRIISTLPGEVELAGYTVPSHFLAAAIAGRISGVEPHRPLTEQPIFGVTSTPDSNERFSIDQLDRLGEAGYWIVWYDRDRSEYVTRHAITTADYSDLNSALEVKTRNLDDLSYGLVDVLRPYKGRANFSAALAAQIETQIVGYGTELLNGAPYATDIGPRLELFELLELRQNPLQRNQLIVTVRIRQPTEIDSIILTIVSE